MRVLVIEDEPLIRLLVADILDAAGHATLGVSTAAAALQAARVQRFDVAVMDLGLPDSEGAALVRALGAVQPRLRLVISTGRRPDDPLVVQACREGGDRIAAVLGKPWTDAALLSAVHRAACRREAAPDCTGPMLPAL
jgi:DNA-binding response OmpR family regulator